MNELSTRTADVIAAEINGIKEQTKTILLCSSIEIGRRLTEAKGMIEYGKWGEWLEKSVDYSQRTASNLIRIFEEYGSNQTVLFGNNADRQAFAKLTYTQAVALLGMPAEEREEFVQENDVESMSTRELQKAIKELSSLQKTHDQTVILVNSLAAERDQLLAEKSNLEIDVSTGERVMKENQSTIKRLQDDLEKTRKQAKDEVSRLASLLAEAKQADESLEKIEQLEIELNQARNQLREATERANAPVTLEPAVVEKVPEEIERELQELRAKAQGGGSTALVKYKVHFDAVVTGFNNLIGTLDEFADQHERDKYRGAAAKLLGKMQAQLGGQE